MPQRSSIRTRLLATATAVVLATGLVGAAGVPPASAVAYTTTTSNTASISIPDSGSATPFPSTITVAGQGAQVTGLQVVLNRVDHQCVKDLDVLLVGPTGQKTTLLSDNGEVAVNFSDCKDIHSPAVTFDDSCSDAGNSIADGATSSPGIPLCYRPSDNDATGHQGDTWPGVGSSFPAANLATFNGTDPNGAWKLYVVDDSGDDSGSIAQGWTLKVTTENHPPVPTGQSVNVNKGVAKAITLTGTDPDSIDTITSCQRAATTANGLGTLSGTGCSASFTAAPSTNGADTFTFDVTDSRGATSTGPGTVTLNIVNRAPAATPQTVTVPAGDSLAVALAGTDPDPGESAALSCQRQSGATTNGLGTLSGTGCNITYKAGTTTGTDSFSFSVTDPFGGTGSGTVTVQVVAPNLPGCTDSDPKDARYVCRTYLDLLGRAAEPSGKAYWLTRIRNGEDRTNIIRSFLGTKEYRNSVVRGIYQAYLGHAPTTATLDDWAAKLAKGLNPDAIRSAVLGSAEFYAKTGGVPTGFANGLYQQALRRPATASEVNAVKSQLTAGKTRTSIAAALFSGTEGDTVTVASIYERFLRRSPPPTETTYWVGQLQRGVAEQRLVLQIVASSEYYTKA